MSLYDFMTSGYSSPDNYDQSSYGSPMASGGGRSPVQQNMMAMRQLNYARYRNQRMQMPTGRATSSHNSRDFMEMPGGMAGPDYGAQAGNPEYQAAAEKMLSPYGLHPLDPANANPFVMFPNSGFAANHPGIAHAIEGGVMGAATTQGSDTWGEGISNVARSLLTVPQMRQQMLNQQYAAPFQQASQMQGLQNQVLQGDELKAMIQFHKAQSDHLASGADNAYDKIAATRPVPLPNDQTGGYLNYNVDSNKWQYLQPMGFVPKPVSGTGTKFSAGVERYAKAAGFNNPQEMTAEDWQRVNDRMDTADLNRKTRDASATTDARLRVEHKLPGQDLAEETPDQKSLRATYQKTVDSYNSKEYREEVTDRIINQNAAAKSKHPYPSETDINKQVEADKAAKLTEFNTQMQQLKSNPMPTVKYNPVTGGLH